MNSTILGQLQQAKNYFYAWQLVEAYNIFRRFYDRLPFKPEKEHAEYIGMFARTLVELGKTRELQFYLTELERLCTKLGSPALAYQLAVVYYFLKPDSDTSTKQILENLIRNKTAIEYHIKAKMLLANIYSRQGDNDAMRLTIDSIQNEPEDVTTRFTLYVWRSIRYRHEKNFEQSHFWLDKIFSEISSKDNWYVYVTAKMAHAKLCLEQGDHKRATNVLSSIKGLFERKTFKSIKNQLDGISRLLEEKGLTQPIELSRQHGKFVLKYLNKSIILHGSSYCEKLILLFAKTKYLLKEQIIKEIYHRSYSAKRDDKLIYSHIHSVRKRLCSIGLPATSIEREGAGYRFRPEIRTLREPT